MAHSNDPERAIRAAQDIHDAMPQLGKKLELGLASHIGIASGYRLIKLLAQHRCRRCGDTQPVAAQLQAFNVVLPEPRPARPNGDGFE